MSRTGVAQQFMDEYRLLGKLPAGALSEHVGGDEEAEEQDQRGGDEQLRAEAALAMMVHLRAGGAADWAASLDDGAGAVCADQVLTAHLVTPFR
jgi:hypothetical protein